MKKSKCSLIKILGFFSRVKNQAEKESNRPRNISATQDLIKNHQFITVSGKKHT